MDVDNSLLMSEIASQRKEDKPDKNNSSRTETISTLNFSDLVAKINDAYHLDWEKEKLEFAQNFLARTWAGMPLPVLSICGRGTQEIRYSKYLGYFLDGTKSHGLGYRYLNELLMFATDEKIDTYNAVVETEKWIGKARGITDTVDCVCDNVIICNDHAVFLEQKINSGESDNLKSETTQLQRYNEAITNNDEYREKRLIRIYITPTGKFSINSQDWKPVSHQDLVRIGLNILRKGGVSSIARENLKRFLLDLLLGPFKKTEDEIQELVELAKASVLKPSFEERLRFDRLVSRNELLVSILMEG